MKKVFLLVLALLFVLPIVGCVQTAQRGFEGGFVINGEEYVAIPVGYTGGGRTIAKAESYNICEIPEDKDHNFLAVGGSLDTWCIVRASYVIPTSGRLNVAYCGRERITDGIKLRMIQSILDEDYLGNFEIRTNGDMDIFNATKAIYVGYEDCPVGTDWLGCIGNINGYLVFVTAEDCREDNLQYNCYILHSEYQELYADSVHKTFEMLSSADPTHPHEYTHEIVEPGCTEEGYTIFTCSVCGYSFISNQAEPYGHAYEIVDQKGEKTVYRCMRCGDIIEE